jgi:DivIVA domain-containing protein
VPLLFLFVVLAVLAAIALVAAGRGDALPEPLPDRAPFSGLSDGDLRPDDIGRLRFAVGLRGYRMDQVDLVLDRLTEALKARDARIAELEAAGRMAPPPPDDPETSPRADPH